MVASTIMRTETRKSKPRCKTISSKEGFGKTAIEMNAVKFLCQGQKLHDQVGHAKSIWELPVNSYKPEPHLGSLRGIRVLCFSFVIQKQPMIQMWKILKEMGIADHLTCLLRNLYAGEEATVRTTDMKQQIGSKQEKEYVKAVYCHPAYLTYMQSTS